MTINVKYLLCISMLCLKIHQIASHHMIYPFQNISRLSTTLAPPQKIINTSYRIAVSPPKLKN